MKLERRGRTPFITLTFVLGALALSSIGSTETRALPRATPTADPPKPVLCAWFGADGNTKYTKCYRKPLSEATRECNDGLKAKNLEGTCDCTDDAAFINGRCG